MFTALLGRPVLPQVATALVVHFRAGTLLLDELRASASFATVDLEGVLRINPGMKGQVARFLSLLGFVFFALLAMSSAIVVYEGTARYRELLSFSILMLYLLTSFFFAAWGRSVNLAFSAAKKVEASTRGI